MQQTPHHVCVVYQALHRSALIAFLPVLFGAGAAVSLHMQSVSRTQ